MASLLEYLQDLLIILFSRTPEEIEKRRLLRQISDLLKNRTPPYYRRFSAQVLPGFAEKLQEYVSLQQTICELLSKTIDSEDAHLAERYRDHLAESRLTGAQEAQIHKFTYPEMKQITATTPNIERVLAELQQKFKQLIEGFDVSELAGFEDDCTNLDRLKNLCRHDYSKIFKFFAFKLSEPQQAPVNGEIILQELLDLYFIFSGVSITSGVEQSVLSLLDRLERERADASRDKYRLLLRKMRDCLEQHLSPELLLNLIRAIKQDPKFQPQQITEESEYLEAYKNRMKIRFEKAHERIWREYSEDAVNQDVISLFSGAELLTVDGYEEEMAGLLVERSYEAFNYIKPMRILKTFMVGRFKRELKDNVKKLMVEGHYANKIFHNLMTNTYYGCEKVPERIREFEEDLQGSGKVSLKVIHKYLDLHDQGKPAHVVLSKLLDSIDTQAEDILEESANLLHNLSVLLRDIVKDANQKEPTQISNIHQLGGKNNKEFLSYLGLGNSTLERFIKIIRNFTKIRELDQNS